MGAPSSDVLGGVLAAVAAAELTAAGWLVKQAVGSYRTKADELRDELVAHGLHVARSLRRVERTVRKQGGRLRRVEQVVEQTLEGRYLPRERRQAPPAPDGPHRRADDTDDDLAGS